MSFWWEIFFLILILQSFFGIGGSNKAEIILTNQNFHIREQGESSVCIPAYSNNSPIEGHVKLSVEDDIDYTFMKIEFIGEMGTTKMIEYKK